MNRSVARKFDRARVLTGERPPAYYGLTIDHVAQVDFTGRDCYLPDVGVPPWNDYPRLSTIFCQLNDSAGAGSVVCDDEDAVIFEKWPISKSLIRKHQAPLKILLAACEIKIENNVATLVMNKQGPDIVLVRGEQKFTSRCAIQAKNHPIPIHGFIEAMETNVVMADI
jgi:hypothetical protein